MRRIVIVAVDSSGHDDLKRWLAAFNSEDLHRRRVCSQQPVIRHKDRILHIPRRMIFGKVERFEIMIVVLDIRAARDLKAHAPEDIDDLVGNECEGMSASPRPTRSGQSDVDALFFQRLRFSLLLDRAEPLFEMLFECAAQLIELLSGMPSLFCRQIFETAESKRDAATAT